MESDSSDISVSGSDFVPSIHSSSESDVTKISKKRKRKPKKWVRNVRKQNRHRGKPYVTKTGKTVPARKTGPECKCKRHCFTKVTTNIRQELLTSFNKLGEKEKQDTYLCGLITVRDIARRRPKSGCGVPRSHTYLYKVRYQ